MQRSPRHPEPRDLVSDSFALVEWVLELQDTYRIRMTQDDLRTTHSVGDMARMIHGRMARDGDATRHEAP